VEGSDKLLKLKIDLGNGDIRQIISGIAKFYKPEDYRRYACSGRLEP
jgi:methionyl-tRNA synthetase